MPTAQIKPDCTKDLTVTCAFSTTDPPDGYQLEVIDPSGNSKKYHKPKVVITPDDGSIHMHTIFGDSGAEAKISYTQDGKNVPITLWNGVLQISSRARIALRQVNVKCKGGD